MNETKLVRQEGWWGRGGGVQSFDVGKRNRKEATQIGVILMKGIISSGDSGKNKQK